MVVGSSGADGGDSQLDSRVVSYVLEVKLVLRANVVFEALRQHVMRAIRLGWNTGMYGDTQTCSSVC